MSLPSPALAGGFFTTSAAWQGTKGKQSGEGPGVGGQGSVEKKVFLSLQNVGQSYIWQRICIQNMCLKVFKQQQEENKPLNILKWQKMWRYIDDK